MTYSLARNSILIMAMIALPGCVLTSTMLGIMGVLTTGPLQYAGTAYTISEYTYEYAVNDKTPDEVLESKFEWLLDPPVDPHMSGYAKALKQSAMAKPEKKNTIHITIGTPQLIPLRPEPSIVQIAHNKKGTARNHQTSVTATHTPLVQAAANGVNRHGSPAPQNHASSSPNHEYIERKADPLLLKMDRFEHGLTMAEKLVDDETPHHKRFTVSDETGHPTERGISGSWSIRHSVTSSSPAPSQDSFVERSDPQPLELASRS